MIDYKRQAQELFEIIVLSTGITEDIQMFNYLCDRFPNLMDDYVKKIEEEVKDVSIPKLTPKEEKRQYEKLMKRIQKIEQNKKTDN